MWRAGVILATTRQSAAQYMDYQAYSQPVAYGQAMAQPYEYMAAPQVQYEQPMAYAAPVQYAQPVQYAEPVQYAQPVQYAEPVQYAQPVQYAEPQVQYMPQQAEPQVQYVQQQAEPQVQYVQQPAQQQVQYVQQPAQQQVQYVQQVPVASCTSTPYKKGDSVCGLSRAEPEKGIPEMTWPAKITKVYGNGKYDLKIEGTGAEWEGVPVSAPPCDVNIEPVPVPAGKTILLVKNPDDTAASDPDQAQQ